MEWISVKDRLPELPIGNKYGNKSTNCLVCFKREISDSGKFRIGVKIGKWQRKAHRKPKYNESYFQVLEESHLGKWIVSNVKQKEITHWMPIPKPPKKENKPIESYFPPPWNSIEHPEKTQGWIEFQKELRNDPNYYLSEFLREYDTKVKI